jgi:hypothetical protein
MSDDLRLVEIKLIGLFNMGTKQVPRFVLLNKGRLATEQFPAGGTFNH